MNKFDFRMSNFSHSQEQRYWDVLKSVTLKDRETYGIRLIIGMKGHTPEQIADFNGISLEEAIRVQKQLLQEI